MPFDTGGGGGGDGGVGTSGGNANLGVLLRQVNGAGGLFLSAEGIGIDGHGVGESSGTVTPANGAHVDLPNNGGGPGVNRRAWLRLHFPADITGFAGANSNNIVVRLNRLDAVAASPVVVWTQGTGTLTVTIGATSSFSLVADAIAAFSTFTITTSIVGTGDGSDVFQLGNNATGTNYNATGGHDEQPAQIELLAEPNETPPRILVKYHPTVHTTLQDIWNDLATNDQGVTITVPHGTDLTAAPEGVPWDRPVGANGSGSPYAFHFSPALDTSNVVTTATAIAVDSDTGATFTILDAEVVPGPVLAGEDFVTQWAGGVYVALEPDSSGNLGGFAQLLLETTHVFNGKTIIHQRSHRERSSNTLKVFTVPLSVFSRRSRITLGTYRAQDGTDVEITAADLAGEVTMTYKLLVRVLRPNGVARRGFSLEEFSYYDDPAHWAYQLARR